MLASASERGAWHCWLELLVLFLQHTSPQQLSSPHSLTVFRTTNHVTQALSDVLASSQVSKSIAARADRRFFWNRVMAAPLLGE